MPSEDDCQHLQSELNKLMKMAVSRHLFWGEQLYIVTLRDWKKNFIYPILSERQSLYIVPSGAGAPERYPKSVKVRDLLTSQGNVCGFSSTKRGWTIVKIEPLSLLDIVETQDAPPVTCVAS